MSRLEDLPADQKAVLQLLLRQGKTYDELATLLRLDPGAVRERAVEALDALGPDTPAGLSPSQQDELADYLLGQQSASARERTRSFLEGSAGGRAWARVVAGELRPLAGDGLPEVPAEGAEVDEAFDALEARKVARERNERSSKLGGILLLVGLGIAVAVVLVIVIGGGSDDNSGSGGSDQAALSQTAPTGTDTTATTGGQPQAEAQINLTGTNTKAKAVAFVLRQNGQRVLAISGQDFPATNNKFFYAVWLYNSPSQASRLGFVQKVTSNGQLLTGADPSQITKKSEADAMRRQLDQVFNYKELVISRETDARATHPSNIVVSGQISKQSSGG